MLNVYLSVKSAWIKNVLNVNIKMLKLKKESEMIINTENLWLLVKVNKLFKLASPENDRALSIVENSIRLVEAIAKEIEENEVVIKKETK